MPSLARRGEHRTSRRSGFWREPAARRSTRARLAAEPRLAARRRTRWARSAGERVLDLCAAPGGKATQLAARAPRSSPSRSTRAALASWWRTQHRSARNADGRERRRARAPARAHGLRPRSRGCALLRPRRAQLAGPTCAGARSRCPSSSSTCCASPPSGPGRAARSPTRSARINKAENEDGRRRTRPARRRSRRGVSATSGIRGGPSSC